MMPMLRRNRLIAVATVLCLSVFGASTAEAKVKGVVYALYERSSDWTIAVFASLQLCQMTVAALTRDDPKFHAVCEPITLEDADRFVRSQQ